MKKVNLPEGIKGDWKIIHRKVDHLDFGILMSGRIHPEIGDTITVLFRKGVIVMSDAPAEMQDHWAPEHHAKGHCLINGLGIGMVLQACLAKPEVTRVTVVEISQDLIDLVGPHYQDPRLEIVCASAFEYQPPAGVRYGMVWHDIWDAICSDNLEEMHRLHRKYGRRADWQGSWARELCELYERRGR